jgi:hypothetical protein
MYCVCIVYVWLDEYRTDTHVCVYVVGNYLLTSVVCRLLFHIVQQKGPVQGLMSSMKTNLLDNKFLENNVAKLQSHGSASLIFA